MHTATHLARRGAELDLFPLGAENLHRRRQRQPSRISRERIMVSMHDEGANASRIEAAQLIPQVKPGAYRAIAKVEQVSGQHQEVNPFAQAERDDPRECVESGALKSRQVVGEGGVAGEPAEGAVEVQISGVNEGETHERRHPTRRR